MSVTTIEWTKRPGTIGETWNPTTGCNKVDRGCKFCYAEVMHRRLMAMMPQKYTQPFLAGAVEHPEVIDLPFAWKKPRTVFVDSMSDLFHVNISFEFIAKIMDVIRRTKEHTYLVLTKRPERAREFWWWWAKTPEGAKDPLPPVNLWLGTSVNDQESANTRIPILLDIPGVLRFLSYEPATGPALLRRIELGNADVYMDALAGTIYANDHTWQRDLPRLHWVIMGGESGGKAVPMHPAWVRQVREDCLETGTPFFFKQWGRWRPITYRLNDEPVAKPALGKNEFLFMKPEPQNMEKGPKSFNLLDGVAWHQFPDVPNIKWHHSPVITKSSTYQAPQ